MKNTMKKILCTVLVVVMMVTGMPFISFGANTLDVTLDISEHTFIDFPAANTPIPFGETTLSFSGEVYNFISIKVECIDNNENIQTKTINDLTNPDVNISFSMPSTPKKIIIKFYSIIDVTLEQTGKIFYFTDKLSTFKIDVNNIGSKSFSENDAENKIKCYTSVKINPLNPFYPNGTANMYYAEYSYDLPAVKQFPSGYNFEEDRWSFKNIKETIDRQYFIDMYEEQKGQEIYEWMEDGSPHGHCFGMATSTAATLFNAPYVTDYISWTGLPYQKLKSVNKGTSNLDMDITAKDYIKYCHIYQGSASVASQRNSNSYNGIHNVYSAVLNSTSNSSGTGVAIDLWASFGGHTVYAIGVDGDDILVNDSNEPGNITRIEIDGDSWTYSAGGWTWRSSSNDSINYVDDVITPYLNITWAVDVEGKTISSESNISTTYTEEDELNGTNSYYANSMKSVDTDKLLVVSEKDSFVFSDDNNINKVIFTEGTDANQTNDLYWVDSGNTIESKNESENPATLKLVGNELKITATIPSNAETYIEIDEEGKNSIDISAEQEETIEIIFTTVDDNGEFVDSEITGTASGSEITATQTETGLLVTGISDGTVTLTKNDEVIETQEIKDAVGEIEITYDKTGEDEDVELDYHSHSYTSSITTPATRTAEGVETFTCDCGDSYTKPVAKLEGHTHTVTNTVAPTCTKNGLTVYTCVCGDSYSETVKAKGHSYGDDGVCTKCDDYNKAYDKTANDSENCSHLCHKGGFMGFIWKIVQIFIRLFKTNPVCECGAAHY